VRARILLQYQKEFQQQKLKEEVEKQRKAQERSRRREIREQRQMKKLAKNRKIKKKEFIEKSRRAFHLRQQYIVDWKSTEALAKARKQHNDKERSQKMNEKK